MAATRVNRAVIVAAGRSSRLYPLTSETPKGLLDVGGKGMLQRSIAALREHGIEHIAMVVGFEAQKLRAAFAGEGIETLFNPFFAQTNNLGSLWFARDWVGGEPFVYLHSDIVYAPGLLAPMLAPGNDARLLVDVGPTDDEAMKVRLDDDGRFVGSSKAVPIDEAHGEWVGIATFGAGVVPRLFAFAEGVLADGLLNAYDTEAFTRMAAGGLRFEIVATGGAPWIEVDSPSDYERAREMFSR